MRTKFGFDCPYFFGDYYRGRNQEECRLLKGASAGRWTPDLCKTCPVPGIVRANSCPNIVLSAEIGRGLLGLKRQVKVEAYCTKSNSTVAEPEVGCGECHPLPFLFDDEDK